MNKFKSTRKRKFFTDGSHGWLKVTKKELEKLGIQESVSVHSYMRGANVYLEEDSDLGIFMNALRASDGVKEETPEYREHALEYWANCVVSDTSCTRKSVIRSYERYEYRDEKETNRIEILRATISVAKSWNSKALRQIKYASKEDLEFWRAEYLPQVHILTL